jgi:restriction system protein
MGWHSWSTRNSTFVGALHGKRARKVSLSPRDVSQKMQLDYVNNIEPKVSLIDGRNLANLMIDCNLGTTTAASYELKRIDSDYFGEE